MQAGPFQAGFQMQQQPRPLQGMPGRGAIRPEVVCRVRLVVVRQWLPEGVEMLDDPVAVGGGMGMDDALGNTQGALEPQAVAGDVCQGQKGLGRVHVAVGATVLLGQLPGAGEGFPQGTLLFAPEMRFEHLHRACQQGWCTASTCHHRRAGGQGDKGMQVSRLAAVVMATGVGEPAAVGGILQRATQGGHTVFGIGQVAGHALQVGQGETVGHAGGDQGFGAGTGGKQACGVEAAEAIGQFRSRGEGQQALPFCHAPGGVGRGVEPAGGSQVGGAHGPA
ncbi:hypothetical protein D3C72_776030 [compost metagenome]